LSGFGSQQINSKIIDQWLDRYPEGIIRAKVKNDLNLKEKVVYLFFENTTTCQFWYDSYSDEVEFFNSKLTVKFVNEISSI
jgi:hypothetical protein